MSNSKIVRAILALLFNGRAGDISTFQVFFTKMALILNNPQVVDILLNKETKWSTVQRTEAKENWE